MTATASPPRSRRERRAADEPARSGRGGRSRAKVAPVGAPQHRRLLAVLLVMCLVAGGLGWRLFDIQVTNADALVEIGHRQRFRTVQLAGGRGDIYDRNGQALAVSVPAQSFFADPKFVEDPLGDAERLAPLLGLDAEQVRERLGGEGRFAWLSRQTPDALAAQIEALDIPGVFATEEPSRFHPAGQALARSVVGNVDIDSVGRSGMELVANDLLEGRPGELRIELGLNGETIPGAPDLVDPAEPGSDLHLTLDRALQFEVERVLQRQIEAMAARGGVVIVTQPATGEVLAMASMTRDDDGRVVSSSLNMATSWSFEPGSVMKAMTFAAVLDSGLADPASTIMVPDTYELYDAEFTDNSPHDVAEWSIADILTVSSNVGTILWGERLGADGLNDYLREFGFGAAPGHGFPGETGGLMATNEWGGVGTATTSLGQGLSVTPVQLISAYNTIANDGLHVPLSFIREIVRDDGTHEVPAQPDTRQVISPLAATEMRTMLENVVAVGTGTNAAVDGYRVAGKTGTARKALDGGGGYEDGAGNFRYVASFAGFLPANAPELSILVTIDQPSNSIYASAVAAPVFAEIASWAVRHFRIAPPSAVGSPSSYERPDVPERLAERIVGQAAESAESAEPVELSDPAGDVPEEPAVTTAPEGGVAASSASFDDTVSPGVAVEPSGDGPMSPGSVAGSVDDSTATGAGTADDGTTVIEQNEFGELASESGG